MKISSEKIVIKVGSSLAVTIPAKDAAKAGIVAGSHVNSVIEAIEPTHADTINSEYEAFKAQYGQTLKNLANR
jgi:antitoxin component of MazEF toxin-antitoxin module